MDISFLLEKLTDLTLQEATIFGEVEGQVKLLRNELEWIRLVLEDADARCSHDKRLMIWVNQIREAAFDAEDVVDEFLLKVEHKRQQRLNNLKFLRFLPTCVSFADKLSFIHELDGRIREINITIEKILANKSRYHIEIPSFLESSTSSREVVVSHQVETVGMEDEAQAVTQMLMGKDRRRQVVAIVGMGGLGKTALAKMVFYQVKSHFDRAALISVSHQYRIRELLICIAYSVMVDLSTEKRNEICNMADNLFGKEVSNYLKDKRYLIVLDDVWSTQVWDGLSPCFPHSDWSRVLITTRDQEIASHAHSISHRLRHLNETESWELFLKRAFRVESGRETVACPSNLVTLGRKITEKCKGLPLPIVLLGDFLSRQPNDKSSWSKILQNMEWQLSQGPESCYGILGLSYINDLPHSLKFCFLYLGTFPKDSDIDAKRLILLWMAEGLVQPRGEETLEEVAEDNLDVLIKRSMIQVVKRRSNGKVKSCRVHDFLHNLAISIARDSKFFEVVPCINLKSPVTVRRLIANDHKITGHLQSLRLRTLICSLSFQKVGLTFFLGAKLLTVLDITIMGHYTMKELPEGVGQLIHLRYFSIRGATFVSFPWSIGRLVNLQILDLQNSTILSLPCSIWKLHQLRYLHSGYSWISNQTMVGRCLSGLLGVDQMTNLQTLYIRSESFFESSGLEKLTQLRELNLFEGLIHSSFKSYPPGLVKLKLECCKLGQDPMMTLEKLEKLRVLKLIACDYTGRQMSCSSQGFPQLEILKLVGLPELEELQVEKGGMPVLKTLQIFECTRMKELPHVLKQSKSLQLRQDRMAPESTEEIQTTDGEECESIHVTTPEIGPLEVDGSMRDAWASLR